MIESGQEPTQPDIDLLMASLRADGADAAIYFGALCTKFVDALGSRAIVSSEGRRLHKEKVPTRLKVASGDFEFVARLDNGRITCAVRQIVKGISLRTDELELSRWLEALVQSLATEATQSESTRVALERLLT